MYKQIIRPLLFLLSPERVHSLLLSALRCYGHLPFVRSWIRNYYKATDKQLIWNQLVFKTESDFLPDLIKVQKYSTSLPISDLVLSR